MASPSFAPKSFPGRRIPLAGIDALVSARLGPTRGLGNSQPACFNRQVAMYLAARIGRWSTTVIGRFYGGRDHSTVCYGIQRIESLSESNPEVDALLADLKRQLPGIADDLTAEPRLAPVRTETLVLSEAEIEKVAELVAAKILALLNPKLERAQQPSDLGEISTGL